MTHKDSAEEVSCNCTNSYLLSLSKYSRPEIFGNLPTAIFCPSPNIQDQKYLEIYQQLFFVTGYKLNSFYDDDAM